MPHRPEVSSRRSWRRPQPRIDRLERGELLDTMAPGLGALFRPSVQPYLISWFRHHPRVAAGQLGVPLLVLQGTHYIQALEEDARGSGR